MSKITILALLGNLMAFNAYGAETITYNKVEPHGGNLQSATYYFTCQGEQWDWYVKYGSWKDVYNNVFICDNDPEKMKALNNTTTNTVKDKSYKETEEYKVRQENHQAQQAAAVAALEAAKKKTSGVTSTWENPGRYMEWSGKEKWGK